MDVSDFMNLTQMQRWALVVDPKELEPVLVETLPYWIKGDRKVRVTSGESDLKGFWYKMPLKGSQQPVSRDNAAMVF